ncbi:hypothetical protein BDV59DRAFT_185833 [Aspergillus ambiguus]|uniref:uncharacterized protein n=1 Tax=Aspergillus ambiguus TaxID=176160 RepID=UPI003CCE0ACE
MSSSSIIFHQGLRCTKVPRRSAPASSSLPSPVTSNTSIPDAAATQPTAQASEANDPPASSTLSTSSVRSPVPIVVESGTTTTTVISTSSTTGFISSRTTSTARTPEISTALETPTTRTASATDPFTPTSTSAGGSPFTTNTDRRTTNSDESASLRTLLGSVFGGMAFIILVFLAFVLFYYFRRRKSRKSWAFSPAEKLLRSGRGSPNSPTNPPHGHQSNMSWYSDSSSIRSLYNYIATQQHPLMSNPPTATSTRGHNSRHSNPFSDPVDHPRHYHSSHSSLEGHARGPLIDTSDPPPMRQAVLPRRAFSADWGTARPGLAAPEFPFASFDERSIHSSDRSLGSTVILPGRSSMGSSLQRFSYQVSLAELGAQPGAPVANTPGEPVTRVSTRSDPFDLEVPAKAMHRRSSGALPGTLPQV